MSVGTSDSTVISSPNPEAHNLNTTDASAAQRDDGSPATVPTHTPKKPPLRLCFMYIEGQFTEDLCAHYSYFFNKLNKYDSKC